MILDLLKAYADHCTDRAKGGRYTAFAKSQDFYRVFSTPEGERVLLELMYLSRMIMPYVENDEAMARVMEGRRSLVYQIIQEVTADVNPETQEVNHRV